MIRNFRYRAVLYVTKLSLIRRYTKIFGTANYKKVFKKKDGKKGLGEKMWDLISFHHRFTKF